MDLTVEYDLRVFLKGCFKKRGGGGLPKICAVIFAANRQRSCTTNGMRCLPSLLLTYGRIIDTHSKPGVILAFCHASHKQTL